jgi:uncharacterized coiled-coil protein SlyX
MKLQNLIHILILIACIGFLSKAQAVGPDTDGSIPGANNGEGIRVLVSRTGGVWNTGTGFEALNHLTAGNQNTATGLRALFSDTNGGFNTATGVYSLSSNTGGFFNSASGAYSLANNISGNYNTANGYGALYRNTAGYNTATGFAALYSNTTGSGNTALGLEAGFSVTTASNIICIGASGANVSDSCFIANIRGITTANPDAIPVLIDSAGQLGTMSSSRRFKEQIKPMDKASEAILALKPVTFHYRSDATGTPQFGLIAEEVAEVNPALVVRDENGEIYTVRYDAVNAMLLNEFLKEHRKVEEQEASITQLKCTVAKQEATIAQQRKDFEANTAQQQKEIQALTASLTEQGSQIQKVSAQLEVNKTAQQIVLNNQ